MVVAYDIKSPEAILQYARHLLHKTLREFVDKPIVDGIEDNIKRKGGYWNMIEKYYFWYEPNSSKKPDFEEAWLELKTSPLKQLKNWKKVAKERLVMNIINFMEIVNEERETSSFLQKNKGLLLIFYLYEENKVFRDYIIELVNIWKFPPKDLLMIQQDWHTIQNKIKSWKADELSEWDTFYLWACTKWQTSLNRREQPFSIITAKQRAFSLKQSYVNKIIEHLSQQEEKEESILTDLSILKKESFEEYIKNRFADFIWLSPEKIADKLWVSLKIESKQYLAILARQILWINWNKIEEFEKANVTMKVLRIQTSGVPKESISFPAFKYKEIIKQDWEDSETLEMIDKKFFFVIFQYDENNNLSLKKVMFRNIPYSDLNIDVRRVFNETKKRILNWNIENLPKISENLVAHVRPHAKNKKDTYEGPDWKKYMKKCFWLNSKYITKQIQ